VGKSEDLLEKKIFWHYPKRIGRKISSIEFVL